MSLNLSYPEKTNLYLTHLNNISKIQVFIPDGVLKCELWRFFINVIQSNTFQFFYHVIQDYNNNFNIVIDNCTNIMFNTGRKYKRIHNKRTYKESWIFKKSYLCYLW